VLCRRARRAGATGYSSSSESSESEWSVEALEEACDDTLVSPGERSQYGVEARARRGGVGETKRARSLAGEEESSTVGERGGAERCGSALEEEEAASGEPGGDGEAEPASEPESEGGA